MLSLKEEVESSKYIVKSEPLLDISFQTEGEGLFISISAIVLGYNNKHYTAKHRFSVLHV